MPLEARDLRAQRDLRLLIDNAHAGRRHGLAREKRDLEHDRGAERREAGDDGIGLPREAEMERALHTHVRGQRGRLEGARRGVVRATDAREVEAVLGPAHIVEPADLPAFRASLDPMRLQGQRDFHRIAFRQAAFHQPLVLTGRQREPERAVVRPLERTSGLAVEEHAFRKPLIGRTRQWNRGHRRGVDLHPRS